MQFPPLDITRHAVLHAALWVGLFLSASAGPVRAQPSCVAVGWVEAVRVASAMPHLPARTGRLVPLYADGRAARVAAEFTPVLRPHERTAFVAFVDRGRPFSADPPDAELSQRVGQMLSRVGCTRERPEVEPTGERLDGRNGFGTRGALQAEGIAGATVSRGVIGVALLSALGCGIWWAIKRSRRDKRRARRFVCSVAGVLRAEGRTSEVRLVDISQTGCKIQTPHLPPVGTFVALGLPALEMSGTIAWAAPQAGGIFFSRPLERQALRRLISANRKTTARSAPTPLAQT